MVLPKARGSVRSTQPLIEFAAVIGIDCNRLSRKLMDSDASAIHLTTIRRQEKMTHPSSVTSVVSVSLKFHDSRLFTNQKPPSTRPQAASLGESGQQFRARASVGAYGVFREQLLGGLPGLEFFQPPESDEHQ